MKRIVASIMATTLHPMIDSCIIRDDPYIHPTECVGSLRSECSLCVNRARK